jgi:large subunit ribosomal protein L15
MDLSSLKPADGSVKKRKRIGRGQGSGRGGTSTRGHKGAQSRSGYSRRPGFEGGQMPLQRRVPKFGFTNPNRKEYTGINLDRLEAIAEKYGTTEINLEFLRKQRIIGKSEMIKILGNGELKSKLTVQAHGVSASAKEAIENAGGTIETV